MVQHKAQSLFLTNPKDHNFELFEVLLHDNSSASDLSPMEVISIWDVRD